MEKYDFPQIKSLIINKLHTYLSCCGTKSKVSSQKKHSPICSFGSSVESRIKIGGIKKPFRVSRNGFSRF